MTDRSDMSREQLAESRRELLRLLWGVDVPREKVDEAFDALMSATNELLESMPAARAFRESEAKND